MNLQYRNMKVLGLRNYSNGIRYCILEGNDNQIKFVNKNAETKIVKPRGYDGRELYLWYQSEINRILDANHGINALAIKQNENIPSCYSKLKDIMFFDCMASMAAYNRDIVVKSFIYNQLGISSKTVKQQAETIVGEKSDKYWDERIADAIVVANKLLEI